MDSTAEVKSILITGCSTGIGLHLARGLKDKGYRVFASARQEADVEKLEAEGFESLLLDLSSSESINCAVKDLFQKTECVYALIHNGAYGQAGALEDISRAAILDALKSIDLVVVFDEDTPADIVKMLVPDVLAKGGDYTPDTIVGADTVIENGGEVKVIPFRPGQNTSSIVEKIIKL